MQSSLLQLQRVQRTVEELQCFAEKHYVVVMLTLDLLDNVITSSFYPIRYLCEMSYGQKHIL